MSGGAYHPMMPENLPADDRLRLIHWRVFHAVLWYDRQSAKNKGQPCFATQATIAARACYSRNKTSAALRDLVRWKYLSHAWHPRYQRRRIYRAVLYEQMPCHELHRRKKAVAQGGLNAPVFVAQGGLTKEIRTNPYSKETRLKTPGVSAGRGIVPSDFSTEFIAVSRFEKALRSGQPIDNSQWLPFLEELACGAGKDGIGEDATANQAKRILEEFFEYDDSDFDC